MSWMTASASARGAACLFVLAPVNIGGVMWGDMFPADECVGSVFCSPC